MTFPKEKTFIFLNFHSKVPKPFTAFADFECINNFKTETKANTEFFCGHKSITYGLAITPELGLLNSKYIADFGSESGKSFVHYLLVLDKEPHKIVIRTKKIV